MVRSSRQAAWAQPARSNQLLRTLRFCASRRYDRYKCPHPAWSEVPYKELAELLCKYEGAPLSVVVEVPHPAFVPLVRWLRSLGAAVIYELIDEWDGPELGWWYFSPAVERDIVAHTTALYATVPELQTALRDRCEEIDDRGRASCRVDLLPNAVDRARFDPVAAASTPTPPTMPRCDGTECVDPALASFAPL